MSEDSYSDQLQQLLENAGETAADQVPSVLFRGVSDDFWRWIHIEGFSGSPVLSSILPSLPSTEAQIRWTGKSGADTLDEAFRIYLTLRTLFETHVGMIQDTRAILDFGCGFGRVIRFFLKDRHHSKLVGSDYNRELIDFCRSSNRWCTFHVNGAVPPMSVDSGAYSYVYAYSVFSHFSEEMHLRWLKEFQRVLSPDGAAALTVRPKSDIEYVLKMRESGAEMQHPVQSTLDAEQQLERFEAGDYCYAPYDRSTEGAWWGEAWIPREYIENVWSRYFELVDFVETGQDHKQHFVLLRPQ